MGRRKQRTQAKQEAAVAAAAASEISAEDDNSVQEDQPNAVRLIEGRKREQQAHDALVLGSVKRQRLARNVRGLARLSRCSPHRLAFQLVAGTVSGKVLSAAQKYRRDRRQLARMPRSQEGVAFGVARSLRLERVAARYCLSRMHVHGLLRRAYG